MGMMAEIGMASWKLLTTELWIIPIWSLTVSVWTLRSIPSQKIIINKSHSQFCQGWRAARDDIIMIWDGYFRRSMYKHNRSLHIQSGIRNSDAVEVTEDTVDLHWLTNTEYSKLSTSTRLAATEIKLQLHHQHSFHTEIKLGWKQPIEFQITSCSVDSIAERCRLEAIEQTQQRVRIDTLLW